MNDDFDTFWKRLGQASRRWQAPAPGDHESHQLANEVLRKLRQAIPDPWTWWTPLARNMALASVVAAIFVGLSRRNQPVSPTGPETLASAFVSHSLSPAPLSDHE